MNDASKDNGYILYGIREEGGREGGREGGGSRRDDDEALLVGSVSSSRLEVSTRKKNLDTPRVTVTCYVMVDGDLLATIPTYLNNGRNVLWKPSRSATLAIVLVIVCRVP